MVTVNYNDSEIQKVLKKLVNKTQDLSPALNEIDQLMLATTDQRFENEVDPYGVNWKPNTPSVQKYKQSRGFIMKVLQRRGMLRNSINHKVTRNSVSVGTDVKYANYHQLGTPKLPKREFLGVSSEDRVDIISILSDHLLESD